MDTYGLEPATTSTSLPAGGVGWDGGDILNAANLHAGTGKSPEGRLGTRSGGLSAVSSGGTHSNVKCVDSQGLALDGYILSSQHSGVGGRFVTIGLDLHAASDPNDGFPERGEINPNY